MNDLEQPMISYYVIYLKSSEKSCSEHGREGSFNYLALSIINYVNLIPMPCYYSHRLVSYNIQLLV